MFRLQCPASQLPSQYADVVDSNGVNSSGNADHGSGGWSFRGGVNRSTSVPALSSRGEEGRSERAAAGHFGTSCVSVRKMPEFSVTPGYRRTVPERRPKFAEAARKTFHRTHRRVAAVGSQGRASQTAAHRKTHIRASSRRARLHRRAASRAPSRAGAGHRPRVPPAASSRVLITHYPHPVRPSS